jgi:hypothetical protein
VRVAIGKSPIGRLIAATLVAAAVGCAPAPRIAFPTGAVTPDPEAAAVWIQTTAACRASANYSAEIVIDGRVGNEKLRRITLHSGFTRDGRIRLEGVAPIGGPVFILAGRSDHATLTLPHDHRVVTAPVADIVDALIGLRFAPADWVDVLAGCAGAAEFPANRPNGGEIGGDMLVSIGARARALVRKDTNEKWRVFAGEMPNATVEYRKYDGSWPSLARITSSTTAAVPLSINLEITQIFVNSSLPDKTFTLEAPPGFEPMTLAELRAIGPLGER